MKPHDGLLLGAIADDLTGATDLALALSRGGMKVRQIVGVPQDPACLGGANAIVVALKSRTIPATDAVSQSLAAGRFLLAAKARQLFFKYCSTFDSTDDGNIGPVLEALLELVGDTRTIACPAFPTNGRTVYKGHLFVGDTLLNESSMKDHPLTPMRDSNLVRVLGRQTRLDVSLIDISSVRNRAKRLGDRLDRLNGVAVVDALVDEDLYIIGEAVRDLKLVTGGSGVAIGLPKNYPLKPDKSKQKQKKFDGSAVILAGSCSSATRNQIAKALNSGMPGYQVDPLAIAERAMQPADAVHFALSVRNDSIPVIFASAEPDSVAAVQARLGQERAGMLVEQFLSETAEALANAGFDRFLVAGGESSGAVIEGLDVKVLDVGPEIDPGVPWMFAKRKGQELALALKSGNFGSEDILLKAWDLLK